MDANSKSSINLGKQNAFAIMRLLRHGERRLMVISNGCKISVVTVRIGTSGRCATPTCESQDYMCGGGICRRKWFRRENRPECAHTNGRRRFARWKSLPTHMISQGSSVGRARINAYPRKRSQQFAKGLFNPVVVGSSPTPGIRSI